jgi:hypothetical protein
MIQAVFISTGTHTGKQFSVPSYFSKVRSHTSARTLYISKLRRKVSVNMFLGGGGKGD